MLMIKIDNQNSVQKYIPNRQTTYGKLFNTENVLHIDQG